MHDDVVQLCIRIIWEEEPCTTPPHCLRNHGVCNTIQGKMDVLGLLYCLVKGPTEAFVYPSSCDAVSRPSLPMHRLRLLGEKLVIRIEAERNFSLLACPGLHLSGLLRRKEFLLPARSRSRGAGVGQHSVSRLESRLCSNVPRCG